MFSTDQQKLATNYFIWFSKFRLHNSFQPLTNLYQRFSFSYIFDHAYYPYHGLWTMKFQWMKINLIKTKNTDNMWSIHAAAIQSTC